MTENTSFINHSVQDSLNTVDLAIAGAGLVGSVLALAIARAHPQLRILLVEANADQPQTPEPFDPRVVALNAASVNFLQTLGVWSAIEAARACEYRHMAVWDGEGTGHIEFSAADIHRQWLGYIVENSVVLQALRQALHRCPNVQWYCPAKLASLQSRADGACFTLDDHSSWRAGLFVGADGARSQTRALAGFRCRSWSYGQTAVVTTVKTERAHQQTAWQRFTDQGPLAFLPLPETDGAHFSSIVWSLESECAERVMALNEQQFCEQLGDAFERRLGDVVWADKRFAFALNQMHVTEYARNSVVLIGDAAHTIHPLAGQGVNLGLNDARVLSDEIGRALERSVPLTDAAIGRRYQRQVQLHNLSAMAAMEGFKRLFADAPPWLRLARNSGLRLANNTPALKTAFMQLAAGESV